MDQTYTSSCLTISADTSSDTNAGFLHDRDMLGWTTCVHPNLVIPWEGPTPGWHYGSGFGGSTLEKSRLNGIAAPKGPRGICCGAAPAKMFMDTSILGDRGWILQERILSRRILHWSTYEVSWECNECIASERLPAGHGNGGQLWGWAGRDTYRPPWNEFRNILFPDTNKNSFDSVLGPKPIMEANDWHDLVREFSRRKLTVVTDRLPAISGLSNAFGKAAKRPLSSYRFGLWEETLTYDLCWFSTVIRNKPEEQNVIQKSSDMPSFSWASINTPIDFLHPFNLDEAIEHVEVVSLSDVSMSPPSITLRGLAFNMDLLAKQRPENPYGGLKDGLKDTIIWDVPDPDHLAVQREDVICLCFGVVERIDNVDVDEGSHGLLGLLLEPIASDQGGATETYRRIGLYDGLRPAVDIREMERRTLTVV